MVHSFETEDAEKYGMKAAVLLYNIRFWVAKNKANGKNIKDGKAYTYNSIEAFTELFPYLNKSSIRRAIKMLEDEGVLISSEFNELVTDRTKWYTLSDTYLSTYSKRANRPAQNEQLDLPKMDNSITDSKHTDNKQEYIVDFGDFKAEFIRLYKSVFTNRRTTDLKDKAIRQLKARIKEGYAIQDFYNAFIAAKKDSFCIQQKYRYCTPEYFTRYKTMDMFVLNSEMDSPPLTAEEEVAMKRKADAERIKAAQKQQQHGNNL